MISWIANIKCKIKHLSWSLHRSNCIANISFINYLFLKNGFLNIPYFNFYQHGTEANECKTLLEFDTAQPKEIITSTTIDGFPIIDSQMVWPFTLDCVLDGLN